MANQQLKDLTVEDLLNKMDDISAILRERFIEQREATKYMKYEPSTIKISSVSELKVGEMDTSTSSVEVVQETVEHDGLVLRKVDREVREGDYFRPNEQRESLLKDGKIYGPVKFDGVDLVVGKDELCVYSDFHNRTPETVEVFEVVDYVDMLPEQVVPLTANQQRHETIRRAREFIEELKDKNHDDYVINSKNGEVFLCYAKFKHDSVKRTTTCTLVGIGTRYIRKKVVARCHPNEVFNEPLGEVISLCKGLNIDIPEEFLNAVQPDEVVVGMKIRRKYVGVPDKYYTRTIKSMNQVEVYYDTDTYDFIPNISEEGFSILDDTHAQYTDGECG